MRHNWSGIVAVENSQTGDGRVYAEGCFYWDEADLAAEQIVFRWDRSDEGAHFGAVEVGRVTALERQAAMAGGVIPIHGEGWVDDEWEDVPEFLLRMTGAGSYGVSVDPDDPEVQIIDTTIEETEEGAEVALIASADGLVSRVVPVVAGAGDPDPGEDGGVVLFGYTAGDVLERYTRARIRAITAVDVPAFAEAIITLDAGTEEGPAEEQEIVDDEGAEEAAVASGAAAHDHPAGSPCSCGGTCGTCSVVVNDASANGRNGDLVGPDGRSITAAAATGGTSAPLYPPRSWFEDPAFTDDDVVEYVDPLSGQTIRAVPFTVLASGECFGHVAPWGLCHTGSGPGSACVTTPRSLSNYAYFRTSPLRCEDGTDVSVGRLTIGGGHADRRLSYAGALEHYDNAAAIRAYVSAGEDRWGVWVHGSLRPDLTPAQVQAFRATPPSGDWRGVQGRHELAAVHHVVSGGFPVARVADGRPVSLVAAGAREMAMLARVAGVHRGDSALLRRLGVLEGWAERQARTRLREGLAARRREARERLAGRT